MFRYLYSFIFYLISPFIPLYLKKRSLKNKGYSLFWSERFGINLKPINQPVIWIHAVSVGETLATSKIIEILNQNYLNYKILITQMTPTGRATAQKSFPNVLVHYLPYDMPYAVKNFYATFKPKLALIMETEIWPNLTYYAKHFKVPIYLINARLSEKSFNSYRKITFFISKILNYFDGILGQNAETINRFKDLGYKGPTYIVGNTKFDIIAPKESIYELSKFLTSEIKDKKIVVFASTRDGEEKLIIEELLTHPISYLVIIVPRHPDRFMEIEQYLIENNVIYQKRSDNKAILPNTQVLLGDSMGEMFAYYNMATLAVIGGSFNNSGGQNPIEAIYCEKPVIFGPSMFNFSTISSDLIKYNCATQANDLKECFKEIDNLVSNLEYYKSKVNNCKKFIDEHRGASQKIIEVVKTHLT